MFTPIGVIVSVQSGDVQELCDALWYTTGPGNRVDAAALDAAYEYIFAHERTSYETYWKTFSPQQCRVLRALATCGGRHVSSSDFFEAAGIYNASSVKKGARPFGDARARVSVPGRIQVRQSVLPGMASS